MLRMQEAKAKNQLGKQRWAKPKPESRQKPQSQKSHLPRQNWQCRGCEKRGTECRGCEAKATKATQTHVKATKAHPEKTLLKNEKPLNMALHFGFRRKICLIKVQPNAHAMKTWLYCTVMHMPVCDMCVTCAMVKRLLEMLGQGSLAFALV